MSKSNRGRRPWRAFAGLVAAILASGPARADFSYTLADLGTLPGGHESQGMALNNSGMVAGTAFTDGLDTNAFKAGGTSMTGLGTLPGGVNSAGFAINGLGSIAGESEVRVGPGEYQVHAFRTNPAGGLVDLKTFGTDIGSAAYGINDAGHVAGVSFTLAGTSRAVVGTGPGSFRDLGGFGGSNAAATAINDNEVVAGWAELASGARSAFKTNPDGTLRNLGTLAGFGSSQATAINGSGDVVGFAGPQGASRAFLAAGNAPLLDLGILSGGSSAQANGINDSRLVVGEVDFASGPSHGFLWDPESMRMLDLNALLVGTQGVTLTDATGINSLGQISGTALIGGELHAVLLTLETPQSVPEPASWLLLAVGGLGLAARSGFKIGRRAGPAAGGSADASRGR